MVGFAVANLGIPLHNIGIGSIGKCNRTILGICYQNMSLLGNSAGNFNNDNYFQYWILISHCWESANNVHKSHIMYVGNA